MIKYKLRFLGAPRLERDGEAIVIGRRKALGLVAYLAVTHRAHTRDALSTLFWPQRDETHSRAILRRALSDLNGSLGKSWAEIQGDTVSLNPDANVWLDADEFLANVTATRRHDHAYDAVCVECIPLLAAAADLYRGDFMAGFSLPDCPAFDEWQFFVRENLQQQFQSALTKLIEIHRASGNVDVAIDYARRLIAAEPWHESAHRSLMELYAGSGRRHAALRQYNEVRRVLAAELDVSPSEETKLLYEQIAANAVPQETRVQSTATAPLNRTDSPEERPVSGKTMPPSYRHNLPAQTTELVGREEDLENLKTLLLRSRLITIVAPGGMGKTRLVLELAHAQLDEFRDGVWFVDLEPASRPEQITTSIIEALSVEFHSSRNLDRQLVQHLRHKEMLLVLDNYEHLLPSIEIVTQILTTAPHVRIVVTSQQRLSLNAETIYPIGGLAIEWQAKTHGMTTSGAVELFIRSARRIRPSLDLDASELAYVEWICRAVEGMPLAIILAASWVDVLSLEEIGVEIVSSLDILNKETGDLPRRQWSIRAVMEAAWQRLTPHEQDVFKRLSLFQGGFTRSAAKAVAEADIGKLRSLVDKSLVGRNAAGRYVIHELPRKYAQEQLLESGQFDTVAQAHAAHFLDFAREGCQALLGPDQVAWLNRLEAEKANFNGAFEWTLSGKNIELGAHLAGALALFWRRRAHYLDATSIGERALRLLNDESKEARLALLLMLGSIYEPLAQYALSVRHYQDGLEIAKCKGDTLSSAFALHGLSRVSWRQGDYASAEKYAEDSLVAAEAAADESGIARALHQLGLVASHQGQPDRARVYLLRSLRISESSGNQIGMSRTLTQLGWISSAQGLYDEAVEYLIRSLQISETSWFRMDIAGSLNTLGWTAEARGDEQSALDYYVRALKIYEAIGLRTGLANTLVNVAFVRMAQNDLNIAFDELKQALFIADETGDLPVGLEVLIGFARCYYHLGLVQECVTLASIVDGNPALNSEVRRTRLEPLLRDLEESGLSGGLHAVSAEATSQNLDFPLMRFVEKLSEPSKLASNYGD